MRCYTHYYVSMNRNKIREHNILRIDAHKFSSSWRTNWNFWIWLRIFVLLLSVVRTNPVHYGLFYVNHHERIKLASPMYIDPSSFFWKGDNVKLKLGPFLCDEGTFKIYL